MTYDHTDTQGWESAVDTLRRTPVSWTCDACHLGGVVENDEARGVLPGISPEPALAEVCTQDGAPVYEFACPWCNTVTVAVL